MKTGPYKAPMKHVYLLWLLVAVVFALFNAAYWPVVRYQATIDPINFVDRAQVLYAIGRTSEAISLLQQGIATHHPPDPQPYRLLETWSRQHGQEHIAREAEPLKLLYEALGAPSGAGRIQFLREAVERSLVRERGIALAPNTRDALREISQYLGTYLGLPQVVESWSDSEKLALLRLMGGPIRSTRVIGATGIISPVDLLVCSGGGPGPARTARIFAGSWRYEGTERGLHVMLVDPGSGKVLHLKHFDLWERPEEALALAAFLRAAPAGVIGLFAVLDNAASKWMESVQEELLSFGLREEAQVNRSPQLFGDRYSFAAIGVKGAPSGTALQTWSPAEFRGAGGHPVVLGAVQGLDPEKEP